MHEFASGCKFRCKYLWSGWCDMNRCCPYTKWRQLRGKLEGVLQNWPNESCLETMRGRQWLGTQCPSVSINGAHWCQWSRRAPTTKASSVQHVSAKGEQHPQPHPTLLHNQLKEAAPTQTFRQSFMCMHVLYSWTFTHTVHTHTDIHYCPTYWCL